MRFVLSFIVLLFITFSGIAQNNRSGNGQDKHEKMEMIKVKFITDKLKLTLEESQKFWPVYNAYQREMDTAWDQKWKNREAVRGNPEQTLAADLAIDQKVVDIKIRYQKKFMAVVPAQTVLDFYNAERQWRDYLMREMANRNDNDKKDNFRK